MISCSTRSLQEAGGLILPTHQFQVEHTYVVVTVQLCGFQLSATVTDQWSIVYSSDIIKVRQQRMGCRVSRYNNDGTVTITIAKLSVTMNYISY